MVDYSIRPRIDETVFAGLYSLNTKKGSSVPASYESVINWMLQKYGSYYKFDPVKVFL